MGQPIRILLVDDHSLFRESLGRLLEAEDDFQVAGNCGSVAEAARVLDARPVDIVLLDHDLGEEYGSGLIEHARKRGLEARFLMVTAGMSDADTVRALEGGSSGIFLKHAPPAQLVEAIREVMKGETWLDSKTVRSLVSAAARREAPRADPFLNERESAVLRGVFEGLANKEIAAKLGITETAVKWVMQQLFDKTGVRTRSQLVRIALEKHARDWLQE